LAINYEESFSRNGATAQSLPGSGEGLWFFRCAVASLREKTS
jgi:hypothetical protein